MKPVFRSLLPPHAGIPACGLLLFAACAPTAPPEGLAAKEGSFEAVRPVLEQSCVHCHGARRLPGMPAFDSTAALAALSGPGKLIVPGAPEQSRFFQVVAFSDDQPGAMPPTGHGLPPREVAVLRSWIADGAVLPVKNLGLKPRGESPRSR